MLEALQKAGPRFRIAHHKPRLERGLFFEPSFSKPGPRRKMRLGDRFRHYFPDNRAGLSNFFFQCIIKRLIKKPDVFKR